MALAYVLGFAAISLGGVAAAMIDTEPLIFQLAVVLAGSLACLHDRKIIMSTWRNSLDRSDWIVLAIGSLYILILLFFFDRIIIWMGGDALAHAEIIRMLLDGQSVPVSIPPLGSYWEYYPKGFHFYAYLWARAFPILDVVRTIPILITAVTPMLLYSIVRELYRRDEAIAIYAFVLACFVFPAHYSNLIWAGYPTIAAEMILVAAVLSVLVDKRLLPILLLGVLFTHARLLVITGGVLLVWLAATRNKRDIPYIATAFVAIIAAACLVFQAHRPEFILSIFTNQTLASDYAARWYPAFLSLFGAAIALTRRNRLDRLAISWAIAMIIMVLLADMGPLTFVASADRVLLGMYLPLSLLAASAISRMEDCEAKVRSGFLIILLLSGTLAMGAVFYSYAGSWAIPQEDYKAIQWLKDQNYSDAVCINLDETGAWIYPLTGIKVTQPRMAYAAAASFDWNSFPLIRADSGSSLLDDVSSSFGISGDKPAVGDWNGDGMDEIGVLRNGNWYLDYNGNIVWDESGDVSSSFGISGDQPAVGDWNGDGKGEIGVFRNGTWYLDYNGNCASDAGDMSTYFGISGDQPAVGDWNGDGKGEIGVLRNDTWYLDYNGNCASDAGDMSTCFGISGDQPAVGDWNGDGKDEIGVIRNGTWYLDYNGNRVGDLGDMSSRFGMSGDQPAVGDWNGDGKDEIGVFRNGTWYLDYNGSKPGYPRHLVYISSVSVSRPGYKPPFAEYIQVYPTANLSYPEDLYDRMYDKGAFIFGFPKGAFV